MKKIGVLGAGTWGMALARMLCNAGNEVIVWSALGAEIDELRSVKGRISCSLPCPLSLCAPRLRLRVPIFRTARSSSMWQRESRRIR